MKMLPQESLFGAPHSNETTSKAAAQQIKKHLPRLERRVWECVLHYQAVGHGGATSREVEHELMLTAQTVTARIRALVIRGLLEATTMTRPTPSGRQAIVWHTAANPPQEHPHRGRSSIMLARERKQFRRILDLAKLCEPLAHDIDVYTADPAKQQHAPDCPGCALKTALEEVAK